MTYTELLDRMRPIVRELYETDPTWGSKMEQAHLHFAMEATFEWPNPEWFDGGGGDRDIDERMVDR